MRPLATVAVLALALPLSSANAMLAYCSQPNAPSTYLSKPAKPYCAATRDCEEWQVSSYRNEVESYYRKLKTYAQEVEAYYADAGEYVQCMARLD